ncbi:MAG TPA: MEKHLA domain-containing protein [Gallionella sp.]|nr:MEKHLA domain-containing protein [Gallionella sp.]
MRSSPPSDPALDERLRLIVDSYRRLTGKELLDPQAATFVGAASAAMASLHDGGIAAEAAPTKQALWEAPRAIVAHGTEDDPVFFYGNRLALELFDMDFAAFTRLPSRYSAEPLERAERARLLERVTQRGYVDDYAGVRIGASGKRFTINAATVWNLLDEAGKLHGQAATFSDWQPL